MATRLVVRYGNTGHRFAKTTQVQLTLSGAAQAELKGSKAGDHHFDVSAALAGNLLELLIRIPAPAVLVTKGVPFLLDVKQNLEVFRLSSGVISLRPHPGTPGNRFAGGYHPRLEGHLVNSGPGHIYYLDLDNTFLNVSTLAFEVPGFMDAYVKAVSLPAGPPAHYGAKLFFFEYTGGKPAVWAVVVPPAVKPDRSNVHALMFFRPVGDQAVAYKNIDDATSKSLTRYLLDPLLGPFHAVIVAGAKKLAVTQNCGFERQVSEANKPIVFISPNSHLSDYGDSIGAKWPKLLRSMMIALWAENAVGQTVAHGLTLGKTAVGGFSFGGQAAFLALQSHPEAIDELYLFDSQGFNAATLRAWFARGGKKLRMVGGGMHHSEMLALDTALASSSATATPDTPDYWMADRLYLTAIFMTSLVSSSLGSPPPRSLSNITGLFLNGPASKGLGISLQGRAASGKVLVPAQDVPGVGGEELAAVLAAYTDCFFDPVCKKALDKEFAKKKDTPPVIPISSAAEFNRLVSVMVERVKKLRHQWCVVGGKDSTGNTDRGKDFRGFLQLCIEKGNLP